MVLGSAFSNPNPMKNIVVLLWLSMISIASSFSWSVPGPCGTTLQQGLSCDAKKFGPSTLALSTGFACTGTSVTGRHSGILLDNKRSRQASIDTRSLRMREGDLVQPNQAEFASKVLAKLFGGTGEKSKGWDEWRQLSQKLSSGTTLDSRTVNTGDLTYGEFDLDFYQELLQLAGVREGSVICDVGSGCGRLVLYTALAYAGQVKECRGIEIIEQLHEAAETAKRACKDLVPQDQWKHLDDGVTFKVADVFEEPAFLHNVDICFCYSTAYAAIGSQLTQLSSTLGFNLCVGARVITIDKVLVSEGPWEFELLHTVNGKNVEVGGSVGYVWKVVQSPLHTASRPRL